MGAINERSQPTGPDGDPWQQLRRAAGQGVQHTGGTAASAGRRAVQAGRQAAQRATGAIRSAGPGTDGTQIAGTPFARAVATAMTARPHRRSASSVVLGSTPLTAGLRRGGRESRRLRSDGYGSGLGGHGVGGPGADDATPTAGTDPAVLDLSELVHVHGRRLPSIISGSGVVKALGHLGREQHVADRAAAVGSLHTVDVSERDAARGALPWTRLCVDTDSTATALSVLDERHLDVVVALPGRGPGEYAADLRLLLPGGLPPLPTAVTVRPQLRLHLLGKGRVAYDDGAAVVTLEDVPHLCRGSLLLAAGRVARAELWVSDRLNVGAWVLNTLD